MIDTLTTENAHDFTRRYVDTYGWLLKENTRRFVYINRVDETSVRFSTEDGLSYTANVDRGILFEFLPVDRGWFLGRSGTLYYLERHPARQWKRGISPSNTRIWSIINGRFSQLDLSFVQLHDIFVNNEPHKVNLPVKLPIAMSRTFAIANDRGVYFFDIKIGEYNIKTQTIVLANSHVLQELRDVISRNHLPIEVQHNG